MRESNHSSRLRTFLMLRGPSTAKEICRNLSISQPVFSRTAASLKGEILVVGKTRATTYALHRKIPNVESPIPLFRVNASGEITLSANIFPIHPAGFYVESHDPDIENRFFENLPYYLEDLRPAGFLGRLIPRQHSIAGYPEDIRIWSSDHCLHYFTHFAWNLVGDFVVGEESARLFQSQQKNGETEQTFLIKPKDRKTKYPKLAKEVLALGSPGSSAGGEQPKFLALCGERDSLSHVLVKFSPVKIDALSERKADLLICENIVHSILPKYGVPTAVSKVFELKNRIFLEIQRFDRIGFWGRTGLISLALLDAEFVGSMTSWKATAKQLLEKEIIDSKTFAHISWLQLFGEMIGNSDMHLWNISFFTSGQKILGLAPVYDMLPMLYAPQYDNLIEGELKVSPSSPLEKPLWQEALRAALEFWTKASEDKRISNSFRKIADRNEKKLGSL